MELTHDNYIFDTTVFVDALRGRPVALNIFEQVRRRELTVSYSIITETELWAGINAYRTPQEHMRILRPCIRRNLNMIIARRAGELQAKIASIKGQRIPGIPDCLIAATAEYYGLVVCSRNTRDFTLFATDTIMVQLYQL